MAEDLSLPDAFILLLENFSPAIEAVCGYRAKLLAQGFSESAAEMMAIEFHALILRTAT